MHKQLDTITEIKDKQEKESRQIIKWLEEKTGPVAKPWVNIKDPYWCIRLTPTFLVKQPSSIFPLGIGQSEQFGFYKKIII